MLLGKKKCVFIAKKPGNLFGKNIIPKTGMILGMTVDKDGQKQKIPALITAVNGEEVTIDFNHPLAGKAITYKFIVTAIK